jgi:hypothetical protein
LCQAPGGVEAQRPSHTLPPITLQQHVAALLFIGPSPTTLRDRRPSRGTWHRGQQNHPTGTRCAYDCGALRSPGIAGQKKTDTHTHTECLFWPCRRRDPRKVRYRTFLRCRNSHPSEGKSLWSGQGVSHDAVWGQARALPLDLLQCAVIVHRRGGLGGCESRRTSRLRRFAPEFKNGLVHQQGARAWRPASSRLPACSSAPAPRVPARQASPGRPAECLRFVLVLSLRLRLRPPA